MIADADEMKLEFDARQKKAAENTEHLLRKANARFLDRECKAHGMEPTGVSPALEYSKRRLNQPLTLLRISAYK